ncbi:NT5E [Lepeophtheirus salmonis]|uniref:5'-nucleotidase n=1 Tax=Lepeophtheirus salmonis TaxID=72036 RepID=A0A7R8CRM3_LEPSM|nr:NT5E [Lepeophtheirus salmonis]CAF2906693.1 NT5E [Lepeophtheirus salmonis]
MLWNIYLCLIILLAVGCVPITEAKSIPSESSNISFDLLHVNDIHAHFDPINAKNGRCHAQRENCYGGFPRLVSAVKHHRSSVEKSIFLNAGDYYQGTIWYSVFKYKAVMEFANILNYTAMSLGNHEFDDGLEGIDPFVKGADFPVLACNIKLKSNNEYKFRKSIVDDSLGTKVGIIGYVSSSTPVITNVTVGKVLEFTDEIECIRKEAKRLKEEEGVEILIALGHSGYKADLKIAKEVEDIDLVVGGHSHTFLYPKGDKPKLQEWVKGEYPTYVSQVSGRVVPVVQAFSFSKYLGHLRLNFDEGGDLLEPVQGSGVQLAKVHLLEGHEDPKIKEVMKPYQEKMSEYYKVVGTTNVDLKRSSTRESTMGNLVTDSMVYGVNRSQACIAFINSGGLRSNLFKGSITMEDVLSVLPFENEIDIVRITGKSIRLILENVASNWEYGTYSTFLQASRGIKMEFYITDKNEGRRLVKTQVRCSEKGPWINLQDNEIYEVILPNFLANGGFEGPNFGNQAISKERNIIIDKDALKSYIQEHSPLNIQYDNRIIIKGTTEFVTTDMQLS